MDAYMEGNYGKLAKLMNKKDGKLKNQIGKD